MIRLSVRVFTTTRSNVFRTLKFGRFCYKTPIQTRFSYEADKPFLHQLYWWLELRQGMYKRDIAYGRRKARRERNMACHIVAFMMLAATGYHVLGLLARSLTTADYYTLEGRKLGQLFSPKPPQHSTIICQMDESDSELDRRCHLENVCWDRRESTFVYFSDPAHPGLMPATTLPNGNPRRISVRRKPPENADGAEFLPLVERVGSIPLDDAIFSDHQVHVFFTSFWAENFGHTLVDDVHPLFALMHAFKMTTRDSVFLYPREIADNVWDAAQRERARTFLVELTSLISDKGIFRMDTHPDFSLVQSNHSGPHLTCVRHLLAGTGNLENLNTPPHVNTVGSWPGFIDTMVTEWRKRLDGKAQALAVKPIEAQLLVFVRKVGRRGFLNLDELVEKARLCFGVETIVINPGEMSIAEQISVAQRATVTFSPLGGISYFNAFLREGAIAIVADFWHPHKNASATLDGYFWDRILSGHQTLRYPVREDEIFIEPPGDATAKTWWDYRDHGATMLDLERALHLIDHALYTTQHVFYITARKIAKRKSGHGSMAKAA